MRRDLVDVGYQVACTGDLGRGDSGGAVEKAAFHAPLLPRYELPRDTGRIQAGKPHRCRDNEVEDPIAILMRVRQAHFNEGDRSIDKSVELRFVTIFLAGIPAGTARHVAGTVAEVLCELGRPERDRGTFDRPSMLYGFWESPGDQLAELRPYCLPRLS